MPLYRKKPVIIEAEQFTREHFPEMLKHDKDTTIEGVASWIGDDGRRIDILTLEGTMTAHEGDWIIKGVNGEFYPCKPDIFEKTYEPVEESTHD